MKKRRLGQGLDVSSIGLGCMGMSEFYGSRNDIESLEVLRRAVDLGVDFFDSADMYGPFHNEELLGTFLHQSKVDVRIASKFGIVRKPGQYERYIDNSPEYIRKACEASLTRLGREHIELYYVHRVNRDRPIEETIETLAQLIKEGKIGHIGLCEVSEETLRRAHAIHPITAVQSEYSLWAREVEEAVLPTCQELGIGFVSYSPLGRGFLTGRFQNANSFESGDFRSTLPRFSEKAISHNQKITKTIAKAAQKKGCSAAQLSLAWLLSKHENVIPIPGTKTLKYLEENAAATAIQLTPEECLELEKMTEQVSIVGERYTAEGMKGVNA